MRLTPSRRPPCGLKAERGSSLLEVLVAMLLLSFGMLALAGMQAYSIAAHKNAANRAVASALAAELAGLIRLNPAGLAANDYTVALMTTASVPAAPAGTPCAFPACTAKLLAATDLAAFQNRVRAELPQGGVALALVSSKEADLWILWEEPEVLDNNRTVKGTTQPSELASDNCPPNAASQRPLPRCFYMRVRV